MTYLSKFYKIFLKSSYRRHSRRDSDNDNYKNEKPSWENSRVKRHADKIQQRKMLWTKVKDPNVNTKTSSSNENLSTENNENTTASSSNTLKTAWTSRLAATTNDTKQINKFQRLMGMKKGLDETQEEISETQTEDVIEKERKKQQELSAQLDRQYAMARATTHMGRGKGLGFNG